MIIERKGCPPNKNTFLIKPITKLLKKYIINGIWIDPYANDNTIKKILNNNIKIITNDLNPEFKTDYHLDSLDFLKTFQNNSIDGIVYDPPYSVRQVSECYKNIGKKVTSEMTRNDFYSNVKKEIVRILKVNGKYIGFGWNSNGISKAYGFSKDYILLIAHGAWHNDTIVLVQTKLQNSLDKWK
jgi:tRNA G10  N-methylase Trm11